MKKKLSQLFFAILEFTFIIRIKFFQIKNTRKKKILVYTDSRGHEITHLYNKHNPFSSYAKYFIKNYNADVYICPEKHTTFFDFLFYIKHSKVQYDYIISQIGVVDFAPRPISQLNGILSLKKKKIKAIFGDDFFNRLSNFHGYDELYNGEKTSSIIPGEFLKELSNEFTKVKNSIWINCNPILNDWSGNYKKQRPKNSNMVKEKSIALQNMITNHDIIDLTNWNDEQVKHYTCDNVHLSAAGMKYIELKIKELINDSRNS